MHCRLLAAATSAALIASPASAGALTDAVRSDLPALMAVAGMIIVGSGTQSLR